MRGGREGEVLKAHTVKGCVVFASTLHSVRDVMEHRKGMVMDRWYIEVLEGGFWHRMSGRWVFQAAVVKARETAINRRTCTRLVKA